MATVEKPFLERLKDLSFLDWVALGLFIIIALFHGPILDFVESRYGHKTGALMTVDESKLPAKKNADEESAAPLSNPDASNQTPSKNSKSKG